MAHYVETEMDKRQRERVRQSQRERAATVAAEGQGATHTAPAADTAPQPQPRKGDRWATFNTFMDLIAPRLTLAERAVWLVMFRHARNGMVQASERQLSTAANIDKVTAGRALRRLVQLRLVWPVFKSTNKGSASRYGLHPQPDSCLAGVMAEQERRQREAGERRQGNGGDRRGRRRKGEPTG